MTVRVHKFVFALAAALLLAAPVFAQNAPPADRVVRMNGSAPAAAGTQATLNFAIYDAAEGGKLLWRETQSVAVDASGQYNAFLGAMSADGLPLDVFAGGAPRWLAVEGPNGALGARTLMAAVPYAVSAANAATLAGRPASDFQLTPAARRKDAGVVSTAADAAAAANAPLVNSGSANFIGKFFNSVDLINSSLYDAGGLVGLNTTTPLDIFHSRFTNAGGTQTGIAVQNLSGGASAYSGMLFYDHTGALRQFQGYNNSSGEYRINNISPTGSINFMIGSTSAFEVNTLRDVGIGTTAPTSRLHVENTGSESIKVKSSTSGFATVDIDGFTGDSGVRLYENGTFRWYLANDTTTNNFRIFEAGVGDRMRVQTGIRTTEIEPANADYTVLVGPLAGNAGNLSVSGDGQGAQGVVMVDRLNDDGTMIRFRRSGATQGTIDVAAGVVSYNAFTGSHFARTDEVIERGMLVSLTGQNGRLEDNPNSELLYGVAKSQAANDPAVMGAYLARQHSNSANLSQSVNPHLVEAVGNGEMWVVDSGRNLTAGEYLMSSNVAGHAMVDPGTFEVSNIVARLAEPIDWSRVTETVQGPDGRAHKRILASVFFESFVIDRTKDAEIASLKERIAALETMLKSLTTAVQQRR